MEKKLRDKYIIGILSIIFLFVAVLVYKDTGGILFDRLILNYIHRSTNPIVLSAMKFISFLGSAYMVFLIIIILTIILYRKRDYKNIKRLYFNSIGSYALNFTAKNIIRRIRPLEFFRIEYFGYSFPSGHSMINISLFLMIAYILSQSDKIKNKKIIYVISTIYILLMGYSRLYLGVHWPTDIIGGYILGFIVYKVSFILIK